MQKKEARTEVHAVVPSASNEARRGPDDHMYLGPDFGSGCAATAFSTASAVAFGLNTCGCDSLTRSRYLRSVEFPTPYLSVRGWVSIRSG